MFLYSDLLVSLDLPYIVVYHSLLFQTNGKDCEANSYETY